MKWVAIVGGVLVVLVLVVVAVGWMLPQGHVASRSADVPRPVEQVWGAITDVARYPSWRTGVKSVEELPAAGGRRRWREVGGDGTITYAVDETQEPQRLVVRIDDAGLPFGGTWTYDLRASGGGTRVTVTERGEVYNPLFRFMSRFVFGHTATIDRYLADLQRAPAAPTAATPR